MFGSFTTLNKSVKLLPYSHIPNLNLQFQSNRNSDWETRYKIAVGSAQGLAYLHQDCVPAILYRDVKCKNFFSTANMRLIWLISGSRS
ncbi:putative non-specific serine/threonine protein kinase [Helianthus anomalus]